jgi:hypothetical protein
MGKNEKCMQIIFWKYDVKRRIRELSRRWKKNIRMYLKLCAEFFSGFGWLRIGSHCRLFEHGSSESGESDTLSNISFREGFWWMEWVRGGESARVYN